MKMLRYLGLMVCVVFITAFASGCGGGGGGGAMMEEEMPPVVVDPGPTDEDRIEDAQDRIAGIVSEARTREGAARSAAAAVQVHADATADQITSALANAVEAQNLLTEIEDARDAADAATTPEQADSAVDDARAKLIDLISAQSAVGSILSAANAVAAARRQREASETALTNNSSLIKHLRDNKLLADAVLGAGALTAGSIVVGPVGATTREDDDSESCIAPCATYAADTGTGADRKIGQRIVRVEGRVSDSKTPLLTGTGRLPHGFDLKNDDGTTFVNAYTDITKTRIKVRTRTDDVENMAQTGEPDSRYEERDFPDTDYLLAGIWLMVDNGNLSASRINAFAYGSQPIIASSNFCVGTENSGATVTTSGTTTTTTTRTCAATTGFDRISGFVKDGEDVTATYRGDANGAYLAGGETSYFRGSVELTAEFQNPTGTGTDGEGSIEGAVTNITAGGQSMAGSIELQKQPLPDLITAAFENGTAIGVVDGKSFSGAWKGQFFGLRVAPKTTESETDRTTDAPNISTTITTTYSPQAPGSVAGTFYVNQQSAPAGSAAFIGAFGAHR